MNFKDVLMVCLFALPLMLSVIYCWHVLLKQKINFRNYMLYITILCMDLISSLNFLTTNKYIRILLITLVFIFLFKLLFKEHIRKCLIITIYCQFLTVLSEGLYTIILIVLTKGKTAEIMRILEMVYFTNLFVAIILFILIKLKWINKLYNFVYRLTDKIGHLHLVLTCFGLMLITNILVMSSYYKIEFTYYFLFNTLMIVICMIVIVHSFRTQNNYNKVSDQYNVAKNSLKDYEDMMTKYRVANHENKNLLLTVRAMTINKEKNIPEYIDSIIENKFEDDEKLLFKMSVIPTGGLRATIYSEILKIKENKIDYNLNIDTKISTIDLIELDTNTIIDMCKIMGVFIDNSIEAVKKMKKKTINIDMYILDNKLCIKVSNNYSGYVDVSKISSEGYTTKGKGHGYGLPLVKKIIANNDHFENEVEVNKNIFSQVLKIRYKKNH